MFAPSSVTRAVLAGLMLLLVNAPSGNAVAHQASGEPVPVRTAVDLATVPLWPEDMPERGFQMMQAGRMDFGALLYATAGDSQPGDSPLESVEDEFLGAYTMVLGLHEDRADASTEVLASVTTFAIEFETASAAEVAADDLADRLGLVLGDEIDGAMAYANQSGIVAITQRDGFVIMVWYSFDEQRFATRQNTEDWTEAALAELALATVDRLDAALERADSDEAQPGTATLQVVGPDALSGMPWPYYPMTDHYRVVDGEIIPYGGELSADVEDARPEGIDDLFISRQQLGDDGYDHMIDITLASFETEADARAFADDPAQITFPPTWQFGVTYGDPETLPNGDVLQSARAEDDVTATGWRTVSQRGASVQVVLWLASENASTNREGMIEITELQRACLEESPEPCTFLAQADFPAAVDAESAESGDFPMATPRASTGEDSVLAGLAFGWEVTLPDDGWEIVNVEFLPGTEYYQLQSGRSLIAIESVRDRVIAPEDCILNEAGMLEDLEERAVIELGSDDPNERKAGSELNHAWAVYTVEPLQEERADQEYTIRIDCYVLVPGEVSLVVTHTAPRDLWIEERGKGERFRNALTLPDTSTVADATTPIAGDNRTPWRTIAMGTPRIWIPLAA